MLLCSTSLYISRHVPPVHKLLSVPHCFALVAVLSESQSLLTTPFPLRCVMSLRPLLSTCCHTTPVTPTTSPPPPSPLEQCVELDFQYPSEGIHRRWDAGFRITACAATPDQSAFVLSVPRRRPMDETQVRWMCCVCVLGCCRFCELCGSVVLQWCAVVLFPLLCVVCPCLTLPLPFAVVAANTTTTNLCRRRCARVPSPAAMSRRSGPRTCTSPALPTDAQSAEQQSRQQPRRQQRSQQQQFQVAVGAPAPSCASLGVCVHAALSHPVVC